jgi:hypothetical protein
VVSDSKTLQLQVPRELGEINIILFCDDVIMMSEEWMHHDDASSWISVKQW